MIRDNFSSLKYYAVSAISRQATTGSKEYQDAQVVLLPGSLRLYDFGSRFYDPLLGRWFNQDPQLQTTNPYMYCGNSPMMYVDPDGELAFLAFVGIAAGIFGAGNTVAHAIRGDIKNIGDAFKYFGQGALVGGSLAAGYMKAPLGLQKMYKWLGYFVGGSHGLSLTAGLGKGLATGDWSMLASAGKIALGNFYIDENASFFGGVWQGISRHTWEAPQNLIGNSYTGVMNTFGQVDRVDYLGGATFATKENSERSDGITFGSYIHINNPEKISGNFDNYVAKTPLYMHEYGHYLQSRKIGPLYLFGVGIPSGISAMQSKNHAYNGTTLHSTFYTETWANRQAAKYFKKYYGVNWNEFEIKYPRKNK